MKYIVANWKMKMTVAEIVKWVEEFSNSNLSQEIIVAPSFVHIPLINEVKDKLNIKVATQDISVFNKGAHTGDIGAFQAKDFCTYSIVGHSERKENLETVISKRNKCLENGIIPIICFTDPQKAADYYTEGVLLAWEDPENISKDGEFREKNPQDIVTGINTIREKLPENTVVLYGGSVNRQNIQSLVNIEKLDGVLVGSASLEASHFLDLIQAYEIH